MEKERNKMSVNVFGHVFEVHMPKEKEQLYLSAAEYANKKIDAYMDAYVGMPLPNRSTQEILLMAMLDIAVCSIECKQSNENCSFFGKIKYILKSFAPKGMNTMQV
ncbi:MAG: cell division protein ZapA [Prevotella sp.]